MTYITVPIDTDPEDLINEAIVSLQERFPGWQPADGNLDYWLIQAMSSQGAETRDVASAVPDAIFRYFGSTVMGIPPVDAQAASTTTTWTAIDNAGYTIPDGTQVGIAVSGDDIIPFSVQGDVIIPPGSVSTPAGAVTIVALVEGADASNIGSAGGPVQLLDPLTFVSTITMVNPTAGGIDAEPDDVYLSRLTDELTLLAPRPILPVDFAIMARDVTGVTRATALDGYDPTATITGRTGTTTSGSPNVTAIAASMTGITAGQAISGAGIPAGTYVISVNAGASTLVMSKNATASATGVALTFTGTFGNAREISVAAVDALGNPVSSAVKGNIDALLQSRREVNFIVNVIDPTYTQIDVTYTVKALTGYDATDVQTRVNQALSNYLSPVNWGGDFFGTGVVTEQTWVNQTTVRYLELAQVINEVPGVDYIVSLTFGIHGGTLGTSDLVLLGPIAMPNPGTMTGTVT